MNTVKAIQNIDDISKIAAQSPITIITSYRGKWCPFCRSYLKDFNTNFADDKNILVVGVSVDSNDECKTLQKKLKLDFDLITDHNIVMHKDMKVKTGKGHGKEAYLQPSVFIYKNGEQVFSWLHKPKLFNFGGAINRLAVKDIAAEVAKIRAG